MKPGKKLTVRGIDVSVRVRLKASLKVQIEKTLVKTGSHTHHPMMRPALLVWTRGAGK